MNKNINNVMLTFAPIFKLSETDIFFMIWGKPIAAYNRANDKGVAK